ncbi:hypothetical protein LX16_3843 [Stackebrandtia albiflava]|uniref:Uncharacterized protein n=1 Tax=Stackebrandtia albiflava TaxID=406432 RepID=A0A562UXU1_9ACTN|nr:hypothetical protein [Stackebrandtia albiflava]TWJ10427.1 hypothetical protein LX16_3843 [Stackebrandtia albiflava]
MTDTANRILWTILALLLTLLGVAAVLAHLDVFPGLPADTRLLGDRLLDWWHAADDWNLWVLVGVGVLLLVVGLWFFRRQFMRRGAPGLNDLTHRGESDDGDGGTREWRTNVKAHSLVHAMERDLTGGQIRAAKVVMTGREPRPDAWVRLDLQPGVTLDDVRDRVERSAERFTRTSGLRFGQLDVTVRPSRKPPARVH